MVGLNLYDETRENNQVDTESIALRKKVAEAVAEFIVDNWDECVKIKEYSCSTFFMIHV